MPVLRRGAHHSTRYLVKMFEMWSEGRDMIGRVDRLLSKFLRREHRVVGLPARNQGIVELSVDVLSKVSKGRKEGRKGK